MLDTSAFLVGFDPFSVSEDQVTVPKVEEEIRATSMSWVRFKTAVENGKLKVEMPSQEYLNKVKASAKMVGDVFFLSETDLQILALALELKSEGYTSQIVTDDYSIQNVAGALGVEFTVGVEPGIKEIFLWERRCKGCGRRFADEVMECPVCGSETKSARRRKV